MPRYHFHILDDPAGRDEEGADLPDLAAARVVATETLGALVRDDGRSRSERTQWEMIVTGEHGASVLRLRFTVEMLPG
jgi:hypothetical protein